MWCTAGVGTEGVDWGASVGWVEGAGRLMVGARVVQGRVVQGCRWCRGGWCRGCRGCRGEGCRADDDAGEDDAGEGGVGLRMMEGRKRQGREILPRPYFFLKLEDRWAAYPPTSGSHPDARGAKAGTHS